MKKCKAWATALVVLGCLSTRSTHAQDSLQSRNLDPVVVTATRFAKSLSETGKVLTIIDEQQLRLSPSKDLAQLLNEQGGVFANGAMSNPGKDKSVYLQGAGTQYTLITIDGIPVNDPSGVGGTFDIRLLSLDQIERIEILKGSQSTLYGSDAVAGVINIITKKGGTKPVSASAQASYGTYNYFRGNAAIYGSVGSLDYRMTYAHNQADGISEAKPIGAVKFDKDPFSEDAVAANVSWQATQKLKISPFMRYSSFEGKYDLGAFADDSTAVYTAKVINPGLQAEYMLKKGGVHLNYAYTETDRKFKDAYGTYPYLGKFTHAEIFGNQSLGEKFQVLAGLSLQKFSVNDTTTQEKNPAVTITSPYASLFLRQLSGFSMEAGGRYTSHSKFGNVFTYSFNPSYLIQQKVKIFFNLSSGFKAPTLYQLYGQYGANPDLKPEQSTSVETGIQTGLFSDRINLKAVYFSRQIRDVIMYGYPGYANLDVQDDQGLELEAHATVSARVKLKAFYTFIDGKVRSKVGGADTTYNNLFKRPRHTFGLNASYSTGRLTLTANIRHLGSRNDLYFDMNNFVNAVAVLDAYSLVDLYGEYSTSDKKLTWFVDAKNVLNADYYEVYGYSVMGATVNVGVRVSL